MPKRSTGRTYQVYAASDLEEKGISLRELRRLSRDETVAIIPDGFWEWVLAALLRGEAYMGTDVHDALVSKGDAKPKRVRKKAVSLSVRHFIQASEKDPGFYDT